VNKNGHPQSSEDVIYEKKKKNKPSMTQVNDTGNQNYEGGGPNQKKARPKRGEELRKSWDY